MTIGRIVSVLPGLFFRAAIAACLASTLTVQISAAQALATGKQLPEGSPMQPPKVVLPQGFDISAGYSGPIDRAGIITSQGLNNPELKFNAVQISQIDAIVETYMREQKAVTERYRQKSGERPRQDIVVARQNIQETLTAALRGAMTPEQRSIWEAGQNSKRGRSASGAGKGSADGSRQD